MKNQFINIYPLFISLFGVCTISHADIADGEIKLVLKNAYIERNFSHANIVDNGSWSQGISGFLQSGYSDTPIQFGLDLSVQYALRLSQDKGVADSILPFDQIKQKQEHDYLKYAGTLKAKYAETELRIGELWLNLPTTSVDGSRQLLTSYSGMQLSHRFNPDLSLELGRIEKVSPRNEEDFKDLSLTINGTRYRSNGLNYIDLKYKINPALNTEYYFGNLQNLFNRHYLGVDYQSKNQYFTAKTRLKYFYTNQGNDTKLEASDNHTIGILQSFDYKNHNFSIGYQQISGDKAYYLLDGYLPELYFINWNVTGFFKEDEKSWHVIYGYKFDQHLKGLNAMIKYSYGYDFKMGNFSNNHENELNIGLNYKFQNDLITNWSLGYLFADYQNKNGNDFKENRLFLNYTKVFK